jgi:hypothetical protein
MARESHLTNSPWSRHPGAPSDLPPRSHRMPRTAPASSPLAIAKAECRAAYQGARAVDATRGAMFDRLYAETLQATADAPAAASAEMWRQSRILFQIFHNRASWPR